MKTVVNLHKGLDKTLFVKNAHIPSIISELIIDNPNEFYKDIPGNIRLPVLSSHMTKHIIF